QREPEPAELVAARDPRDGERADRDGHRDQADDEVAHRGGARRAEQRVDARRQRRAHAWAGRLGASVRSQARSLAERARGLRAVSSSLAITALRVTGVHTAATRSPARSAWAGGKDDVHARSRKRCLTRRSSSEWKLMTTQRPPRRSRSGKTARKRSSSSSSPLTAMRRAWKVRVAGWIFDLRCSAVGMASATSSARSRVVATLSAFTISLTMRAIFL